MGRMPDGAAGKFLGAQGVGSDPGWLDPLGEATAEEVWTYLL